MLQKIIVVIVGLIMSVVGALSPDLIAGKNAGSGGDDFGANTAEETLATMRASNGEAFARVSVLWVEVDGRRVTDDAWSTGKVDEIRFKVGVKEIDEVALAVGEKVVPLHPTDIITIRMFKGDYSFRGIGTPLASVQLQGTVKTTVLNEGDLTNRVLTRVNGVASREGAAEPGDQSQVAYVVLTTGQKVETVAIEDGGARLFTEEAAMASEATNEPGNLLAKWVKVDGKLIREYTWGDGVIPKIEFEPAENVARSIVIAFNGETFEVAAGERVVVEDFVGEYLIYQVSGGMMRLRLDGYARAYITAPAVPTPQQGGAGAPSVTFSFAPPSPKTTDTVQFRDESSDDGIIVFRQWDYGDNSSGVIEHPTHRYARPGTYEVRLSVTDNDLKTSNVTRTVVVRNAEPVADFDFNPKVVNTDTVVAFTDHSYDPDGTLVNWTWDFGDGTSGHTRHPTHRFVRAGNITVTLTATDEMGGRSSLSKIIVVRNSPPLASFTYAPGQPLTRDNVQFLDNSTDRDGRVVSWNWSFGDGRFGAGSAPVHAYARPGLYVVTLTVRDDMGDPDTASTTIIVGNRPPFAEFMWTPTGAPAGTPVTFTSQSSDPDGIILTQRWGFGDGTAETTGGVVTHTFASEGTYNVTLTVTDNTMGVSTVMRSVTIANSAPRASMIFAPSPTYRGVEVTFSDTSTDPDGDSIVNTTWDFGDGSFGYGRVARHVYGNVTTNTVTLVVRDENGQSSTLARQIRVLNRPPTISAEYFPRLIRAGDTVQFNASGADPDLEGGPVSFLWNFSDGQQLGGDKVNRSFPRGTYTASVRAFDSEGGVSAPIVLAFVVEFALPRVDFTWDPPVPSKNQMVNFTDASSTPNGGIRDWRWTFGDNTAPSVLTDPSHVYARNGTFSVRLEVTDLAGRTNHATKQLVVNLPPEVEFATTEDRVYALNEPLVFQDDSFDRDGEVVNWSWNFGDGTTSHARHPTHAGYGSPGAYTVALVVTDDLGATNRTTRSVNIANALPIATWTHDTSGLPLQVGTPIVFDGSGSSDPDGFPITSWAWSLGDSTFPNGTPIFHTYTKSGRYTVGLQVSDGGNLSERVDGVSHKALRVTPDHAIRVVVGAKLPDGSAARIGLAPYALTGRILGEPVPSVATVAIDEKTLEMTLDNTLWVDGDDVVLRLSAPFLTGTHEATVELLDSKLVVFVNFTLRMAATGEIVPAPGDVMTVLPLVVSDTHYGGDPLYGTMTERPRGSGRVLYADASPAAGVRVDVEARWVPLKQTADLRNRTTTPEAGEIIQNWCRVASATTAVNGTFLWGFDGSSQCYLNSLGVYPVGRWEVRARPQVPTAENKVSPIRAFYVDPTGGLILRASLGLA